MKALTYIEHGKFALTDKPKPQIIAPLITHRYRLADIEEAYRIFENVWTA